MKNAFPSAAALILAILFFSPSAWPWGRVGLQVASQMAEERLTPAALKAVHDLLGSGVNLADISTWADEQRNMSTNSQWHYIAIPITESRYDPKFCQLDRCVVSKIEDFQRVLRNPKAGREEKQKALKFLVHFLEDLCQPFHVADNNTKGGNLIQVSFYGIGSNLHRVWDSQIIEKHTKDKRVWLGELNGVTNPKLAADWSKGNPEDWATDTLQIAKLVYCLPGTNTIMPSGTEIVDEYCKIALPLIQKQLAKAGVRVAAVLNEIFK
jgi:nuclease S1